MIFYSSELFFGNDEVAKKRHFHNADSMNIRIIDNWNSIVTPSDEVYILGGVGQFDFLLSLNGEKTVMLSPYEQQFYDEYVESVTTDLNDIYNDEMFSVYLRNKFYVNETVYERSFKIKDYTGDTIKLSTNSLEMSGSKLYTVFGSIGENYRALRNGINSNIYVNGMFPLSEVDMENIRRHQ